MRHIGGLFVAAVALSQSPGQANTDEAFARVVYYRGEGSRLEKVVMEVRERDSAKESEATASFGGYVIVS
jgi:hypothetical protein